MDERINLRAVEHYCDQYAARVLDAFYANKTTISGSEILQLCEIRQINLFVIRELFKAWKAENKKIKSAYFDYEAPPVKRALEELMNTLSNHILVERSYFEPILKKAVHNTVMLIVDPYDFFADLIEEENQLEFDAFKEELKYLKINRAPLERLLKKIEEKNLKHLTGNEAFSMLDQILEEVNFTPEDVDDHLRKLSNVLPVSIDQFYESKKTPSATQAPPPKPVQTNTPTTPQKPSINEKLAGAPKPTLADNFKKIGRIKDHLTINQKFMFTKVLFHGDFELFSKAIDDLDRQDNIQGALKYLEHNYEEWDRESEEFHEFMELIEMRFNVR